MAPRIESNDPHGIAPLRERSDGRGRVGIGEVRTTDRIECAGGHRQCTVHRVRTAMAYDHVPVLRTGHGADDRPPLSRGRGSPKNGDILLGTRDRMRRQTNVIAAVRASHRLLTLNGGGEKVSQTNEQSNIAIPAWRPIALGEIGAGTTYKVRCDDLAFTLSGTKGRYY